MLPIAVWHTQRSNAVNGAGELGNVVAPVDARFSDSEALPSASQLPLTGWVPVGQICGHSTPAPAAHALYSH